MRMCQQFSLRMEKHFTHTCTRANFVKSVKHAFCSKIKEVLLFECKGLICPRNSPLKWNRRSNIHMLLSTLLSSWELVLTKCCLEPFFSAMIENPCKGQMVGDAEVKCWSQFGEPDALLEIWKYPVLICILHCRPSEKCRFDAGFSKPCRWWWSRWLVGSFYPLVSINAQIHHKYYVFQWRSSAFRRSLTNQ